MGYALGYRAYLPLPNSGILPNTVTPEHGCREVACGESCNSKCSNKPEHKVLVLENKFDASLWHVYRQILTGDTAANTGWVASDTVPILLLITFGCTGLKGW